VTFGYFAVLYLVLIVVGYVLITAAFKEDMTGDAALDGGMKMAAMLLSVALSLAATSAAIVLTHIIKG
jgi:hypothetical protein